MLGRARAGIELAAYLHGLVAGIAGSLALQRDTLEAGLLGPQRGPPQVTAPSATAVPRTMVNFRYS